VGPVARGLGDFRERGCACACSRSLCRLLQLLFMGFSSWECAGWCFAISGHCKEPPVPSNKWQHGPVNGLEDTFPRFGIRVQIQHEDTFPIFGIRIQIQHSIW
jgi:hypothetical protein